MVYWLSLDVVVEQRTWKRARRKRDGIIEDGIGRKGNKEGKKEEVGVTIDCGVGLFMGVPMRTICSKELVVLNVYTLPSPPASQSNKRAVATVPSSTSFTSFYFPRAEYVYKYIFVIVRLDSRNESRRRARQ